MTYINNTLLGINSKRDILPQMFAIVSQNVNWNSAIIDHIGANNDDEIVQLNNFPTPPEVEPGILRIAARTGIGVINVNYFSRLNFDKCCEKGTISPHYHRRSFASRILKGSYQHILFDNFGTIDTPELSVRNISKVSENQPYSLRWDDYHFVMYPEDGTTTLTYHTEPSIDLKNEFPTRSRSQILYLRDSVINMLSN